MAYSNMPFYPQSDDQMPSDFDPHALPDDAIVIIGAGYFGKRAAHILARKTHTLILVIDQDHARLQEIRDLPIKSILSDGILFLSNHFHRLKPGNIIIPALPLHLAFEWLKHCIDLCDRIKRIGVPEEMKKLLPYTWSGRDGSLLTSFANFCCPDHCPEPDDHCMVTGESRLKPLYQLLGEFALSEYRVHIIRSRQLAPGLGGYMVEDLKKLHHDIYEGKKGKWLVGTACRCHGVVSALEITS